MENKEKKNRKNNNPAKKKSMRLPLSIGGAVFLWLFLLISFFAKNDIKKAEFNLINDYMTTDVYYTDGTSRHFEDGNFDWLHKGDRAVIHFNFPADLNDVNRELYIPLYNAILNVYCNGEALFEDEYDKDNIAAHYGGRIYEVILPPDYKSGDLTLEITSVVNIPYSDMRKFGIVQANEGWRRKIEGQSLIFAASLSLMMLSLICIFYFLIRSIANRKMHIGFPISVFEFMINTWFFGSLGMFYLFVGNVDFCAKVEYYSLYLATLPLAFFIYSVLDVPVVKRVIGGVTLIYTVFYIVTLCIELSPIQLNYSDMLMYLHILAGTTILLLVIAIFVGTKHEKNNYISILRFGVLISMLCGVVELVRFNLTKFVFQKTWFATHGLSAVAIIVIAASLVIYLISITAEEYTLKVERKQLVALAFKDALTDMSNRAACYRRIEEMENQKIREYTMVFIDLNNLKTANDVYGHETGDRLLKTTANYIMEVFTDDGFCARWGGDEFVACVFGAESLALKHIKEFQLKMANEDASGSFPFKVAAACGCRHSDEDNYIEPIEAIRQADEIMYENKKMMKAAR